jgi:hypothetical protein
MKARIDPFELRLLIAAAITLGPHQRAETVMAIDDNCPRCKGPVEPGWVCAEHQDKPWEHDGCGWGGLAMPSLQPVRRGSVEEGLRDNGSRARQASAGPLPQPLQRRVSLKRLPHSHLNSTSASGQPPSALACDSLTSITRTFCLLLSHQTAAS